MEAGQPQVSWSGLSPDLSLRARVVGVWFDRQGRAGQSITIDTTNSAFYGTTMTNVVRTAGEFMVPAWWQSGNDWVLSRTTIVPDSGPITSDVLAAGGPDRKAPGRTIDSITNIHGTITVTSELSYGRESAGLSRIVVRRNGVTHPRRRAGPLTNPRIRYTPDGTGGFAGATGSCDFSPVASRAPTVHPAM